MAGTDQGIVIVGAALAGATAAKTLRDEGYDGPIRLFGAETHHPYIRPPLSKGYLAGREDRGSTKVLDDGWYDEHEIDLRLGVRVVRLDLAGGSVVDDDDRVTPFGRLLLATGSQPTPLEVPGADAGGVHSLRTIDESVVLRDLLAGGGRTVAVIGSGWIGMEVAATATSLGNDVILLERGAVPLAAALGDELGGHFAALHERNGVRIRPHSTVVAIETRSGAATGVRLTGGEVVRADIVVIGIGVTPDVGLAADAGLATSDGVDVDAALRTRDPRVFAAGDIANAVHPFLGERLRSEHWANAETGGADAAKAMLGQGGVHDEVPYFYTDQFDLGMEFAGFAPLMRGARVVYRGNPDSGEFIAFWTRGRQVVAGMNVNVWDVNERIQALIRSRADVDPAALADPDVPIGRLGG